VAVDVRAEEKSMESFEGFFKNAGAHGREIEDDCQGQKGERELNAEKR